MKEKRSTAVSRQVYYGVACAEIAVMALCRAFWLQRVESKRQQTHEVEYQTARRGVGEAECAKGCLVIGLAAVLVSGSSRNLAGRIL
jgi:hypothetical protein